MFGGMRELPLVLLPRRRRRRREAVWLPGLGRRREEGLAACLNTTEGGFREGGGLQFPQPLQENLLLNDFIS